MQQASYAKRKGGLQGANHTKGSSHHHQAAIIIVRTQPTPKEWTIQQHRISPASRALWAPSYRYAMAVRCQGSTPRGPPQHLANIP